MRRGSLKRFSWIMVLLAGLFQVLTLILDQIVIQKQDENRRMIFERSSSLEKRNLLLNTNDRVVTSYKSNDFLVLILSSSNISKKKKDYLYFSGLFDQTRLMEDIFRDEYIKKIFSKKTLRAYNRDLNPDSEFKNYNYIEYFNILIKDNHETSEEINENLSRNSEYYYVDGEILTLDDGRKLKTSEVIQSYVQHNIYYLDEFNRVVLEELISLENKIRLINEDLYENNSSRQIYLLSGVSTQLLSLFFLLLLFRDLLIIPKKIKKSFFKLTDKIS